MIPNAQTGNHGWLLLLASLLAAVIFVYPLTLGTPLLDPDEGLHAAIAQEMAERGDWITPRFRGEPFLDKPIFYFWAEALSLRMFGMNEAAVRLPGLMFGLLGAVTTAIVAWRLFGHTIGLVSGMLYTTMILPVALAQAAAHDVALVPCVNLALLLFWESDRVKSRWAAAGCTLAIGLLLGLSILTKGLAGVALVGAAYGCYLLVTRRLTVAACVRGAAALGIAGVVASTWYAAVESQHPGYLYYYFVERHLLGFATDSQIHGGEPWWYYLPILLGGSLPWIGYLPITVRDSWARWKQERTGDGTPIGDSQPRREKGEGRREKGEGRRVKGEGRRVKGEGRREKGEGRRVKGEGRRAMWKLRSLLSPLSSLPSPFTPHPSPLTPPPSQSNGAMVLLWCWIIGCTLLLSLSHSKLVTYIWPVFPAVAILAAIGWGRWIEGTLSDTATRSLVRTLVPGCVAGPFILPIALFVAQAEFSIRFSWPVWVASAAAAAASAVPLSFLYDRRRRATFSAATFSAALQFAVVMTVVLPPVAATTSARDLACHFNRLGRLPSKLLIAEARIGSLVFYLEPELRAALREDQLKQVHHLYEFSEWDPSMTVAVPERRVERVNGYVDLDGLTYESTGRHRLYRATELRRRLALAAATRDTVKRR